MSDSNPKTQLSGRQLLRRNLLRSGGATMAVGYVMAAVGAVLISRGGMTWEGFGSAMHRLALMIMLLSMIIVFLGARLRVR